MDEKRNNKVIWEWIILLIPVFVIIIIMVYWGMYCYSRPSLKYDSCNDAMLQQLTSYYETMITILVMIITILLATSFVSIYYVTKRQVRSTIEEVVIETVDAELNHTSFKERIGEKVQDFCQSPEGLDILENNTELGSKVIDLTDRISTLDKRLGISQQDFQELKDEVDIIKNTYSKKKSRRSSKDGVQETDNKQSD